MTEKKSRDVGIHPFCSKIRKLPKGTNISVLFTCVGRRVSLVNSFRHAARELKIKLKVYGTETTPLSSALQVCDKSFLVKPTTHPVYIKQLLSIVKANKIKLLIPTVDLDLKILAKNRDKFASQGCCVLISNPDAIDICQDKRKTYRFLKKHSFDTPVTKSIKAVLKENKHTWPYFVKPWDGYASRGTAIVENRRDLLFCAKHIPNPICQEFIRGDEYTCDVYVDFDMNVRCVVPRKRIETRAGEVSKGQVVKNRMIMDRAADLVEKLGAGPGIITIQLFLNSDRKIKFIEINPRFGGGIPLSIKAGANFPKWILQEITGGKPAIGFDRFKDKLIMLRYDGEVWLNQS